MTVLRAMHFGYTPEMRVIFRQTFTGNGSDVTFQLTNDIGNAVFAYGEWEASNIEITLPAHVTTTAKGTLYDGANPLTRNAVAVQSISAAGLVTLDHAPQAENFYVWYWYDTGGDVLSDYYREEFVASMEGEAGTMLASVVVVDTAAFGGLLDANDDTVQKAFDSIDDLTISSDYGVTGTVTAGNIKINTPQDLQTGASPTFVTAKLTGLADGYVPYHVSDAAGLANGPLRTDGTNVGLGQAPSAAYHFAVVNEAVDVTTTYYGSYKYHIKTAGVTDGSDNLYGDFVRIDFSQADGIIGDLRGYSIISRLDAGTLTRDLRSFQSAATMVAPGGTVGGDVYGAHNLANIDAGTITGAVYGTYSQVDIEAAVTSVGGNVYGCYIWADVDKDPVGSVYLLYLFGASNVDFAIYQGTGTAPSYLAGYLGLRTNAPVAPLEVEDAATAASMLVKITQDNADVYGLVIGNDTYSTTDTNGLKFKVDNSGNVLITWTAGDFTVGPDADTDALKLDSSKDLYLTDGDLYLQEGGTTHIKLDAANEVIYVGVDDTLYGSLVLYGQATGSNQGGKITLYSAADDDTFWDHFTVGSYYGAFRIQGYYDGDYYSIMELLRETGVLALIPVAGGDVYVGMREDLGAGYPDACSGRLSIFGVPTGEGASGGSLALYTAGDHNDTITHYSLQPYEDDLIIGPNTDTDALKLDSNKDLWITDGDLHIPNMKSGANQGAAGAAAGELWHDTNDNTVKIGV